ncbi:glycosyltransferase family 4 protein [Marinobacter sp.]|uniref:glycosyltransferase family 4 protein n=1 Tax=Marinobacter sp. TaxID=50741 RepID=UPI002B273455|nr:glycosyltransferase family 4 protein [Marinobacter sp.]
MREKLEFDGTRAIRILVVARWPIGGIRTFLKYVYQEFLDGEFEFTFLGADTENSGVLDSDLAEIFPDWSLFPANGSAIRSCIHEVRKTLSRKKFDLVHAHGFTSTIACAIPARAARVPLICTSHDVLNPHQFKGIRGWLKKLILSLALNSCDRVHSVSFDALTNLETTLPMVSTRKHLVIRNGVQTTRFRDAKKVDLKRSLHLSNNDLLIGFFGRFMSQKGFSILVDAVEYLNSFKPSLSLNIVCVGSGGFIREEKAMLDNRGLSGVFNFYPYTPDISGHLKACDIVVMPSLWEACPLQPMEALSAGVPFVGSDCIGLREVLEDTPAVLVKAGSAESLANGIVECLEKGRQPFEDFSHEAVDRFEVRRTADQMKELYEQVCR